MKSFGGIYHQFDDFSFIEMPKRFVCLCLMSKTNEIRYGHQINFQFSFPEKIMSLQHLTTLHNKEIRKDIGITQNRKERLYFYDKLLSNYSIINTFSCNIFAIYVIFVYINIRSIRRLKSLSKTYLFNLFMHLDNTYYQTWKSLMKRLFAYC